MKRIKFAVTISLLAVGILTSQTVVSQPANTYYAPPPPPGYMPPLNRYQGPPPPGYYPQFVARPAPYPVQGRPTPGYGPAYGNAYPPPPPGYFGPRNNRGPFGNMGNYRFPKINDTWWGGREGPDTDWFMETPRRWMTQGPKEGAGQVFDDFLDGPSRLGDMPGGWSAPTISVPNPIDVAEELERGSRELFSSDLININP